MEAKQGILLHSFKAQTRSGVNAYFSSLREINVPEEFASSTSSNTILTAKAPLPIEPGYFRTRKIGANLNITAVELLDGSLHMIVNATLSSYEGSEPTILKTGSTSISYPQPLIHRQKIAATIDMASEAPQVLGGLNNFNGDAVTYLIITATIIDQNGNPVRQRRSE